MPVFHWTTKKKAERIFIEGLDPYSFFCREPTLWYGEVCLLLDIEIDWSNRDPDAEWQGITKERLDPRKIRRLEHVY